jgi:triphosphatase
MEAGSGAEIEWQLDAPDLRPVRRWIEEAGAAGVTHGVTISPAHTVNQLDTYFDTADRTFDRAGYSVRLRRSRRPPAKATLKSLDEATPDALRFRLELEEEVDADEPTPLASAPGPVGKRVRALAGKKQLRPLFDVQTRRRAFPLTVDGTPSGELLLDETAIREPGGAILGRLRRVEVEVPATAIEAVSSLVEELRSACGLQPAVFSKYEAALAASGSRRAEPEDFGVATIEPGDAIGQVALAILRRQFTALLAKEPGTRLGDDVEELHDMRVATRRLRAAISLFAESLPAEAERLRPELAWLGQTIGVVRDLDVQLEQLDEWADRLPVPDREALQPLREVLEAEREQAREEMLQALDSPRYTSLLRRFGAMLRSRSGVRTAAARAAAPELIVRRHRALQKARKRARPDAEPAAYHRLRIAAKRYRYALEFLSDVYPGETKRLITRVVALQDLLGAYQDAYVATARLRDLARERAGVLPSETVFAMGELAGRRSAGMDRIRTRMPRVYARVGGKSWKRLRKALEKGSHPSRSSGLDEVATLPAG